MQDHDTQRELLKETVSPTKALKVAKHMEMEAQNQQKINQNSNTTRNRLMLLTIFKDAIATRITNNLRKISLATKHHPELTVY